MRSWRWKSKALDRSVRRAGNVLLLPADFLHFHQCQNPHWHLEKIFSQRLSRHLSQNLEILGGILERDSKSLITNAWNIKAYAISFQIFAFSFKNWHDIY